MYAFINFVFAAQLSGVKEARMKKYLEKKVFARNWECEPAVNRIL